MSGSSTPPSPSETLNDSSSTTKKSVLSELYCNRHVPACTLIEHIAFQPENSSAIFVYDLAEHLGFGILSKQWAAANSDNAPVVHTLQTRAGAGLSLVGRLSEGTSREALHGSVLTAYTSLRGLSMMAPALAALPTASSASRLILQVPEITEFDGCLALSSSAASLATTIPVLPKDIVVLISATPQESVHFAQIAYQATSYHVVHVFDHRSASRELGHSLQPLTALPPDNGQIVERLSRAGYSPFQYVGGADATTVIVILNGPLAQWASSLAENATTWGVVIVCLLRPWNEDTLRSVLPKSTKSVHTLDDVPNLTTQGLLYLDILSSLLDFSAISVLGHKIIPLRSQAFFSEKSAFPEYIAKLVPEPTPVVDNGARKMVFFTTPSSPVAALPYLIADVFLDQRRLAPRFVVDHDAFSKAGGITASRLLLASSKDDDYPIPVTLALPFSANDEGQADFIGILDQSLLKTHYLLKYASYNSTILVDTTWPEEEFIANVPPASVLLLKQRSCRLFTIDSSAIATRFGGPSGPLHDVLRNFVGHLSFTRLFLGVSAQEHLVLKVALGSHGKNLHGLDVEKVSSHVWSELNEIDIPSIDVPADATTSTLKEFESNAVVLHSDGPSDQVSSAVGSWHHAAKHLLFPTVFAPVNPSSQELGGFGQNPSLRPEVPDRTFLVTCTVNRRLTPLEYDRNVFHLEFDTSGTGLKYAIGEALGVHGWNDTDEVTQFCEWYGVNPNQLITIPVAPGEPRMHTRTIFQSLQQQVDLFGRPPKSFYTDLAVHAKSKVERLALLFIGSPEGSATLKKLSEKDTVTFSDVLHMYPSARPSIETLCEMVGDIKPRHYSIASAQSVVGDRVDLLVVTVDWLTPDGSPRFGQCTRYLDGLIPGQKVTVSIKPSVMKLPPDNRQPLIMAGLGTGAAPFRAFLQHRAALYQTGEEVGPVYYYFGSRHQSQEYLYGEEIESFIQDAVITRAGLAFSRDGPRKVYIQHKMLEDSEALARMLSKENGVFYLCGPTWPVPDVYEALVNALVKFEGKDAETAGAYLEGLKEEERYVLEVY